MNSHTDKTATLFLALMLFIPGLAIAGEINIGYFGAVAIKGYDPVAYFTEHRAVKGAEDISHHWLGADWKFASLQHKQLFAANPVKYAPQYGGHCADGIAYGETTANINPQAWRIIDGKLYLNSDHGSAAELEEVEGQLARSVENWPGIRARLLSSSD
jgi:hypothetical protein